MHIPVVSGWPAQGTMGRAAVAVVLVTLGCHGSVWLVRGTNNERPYGQFRRRRSSPMIGGNRTAFYIATPSSPPTGDRERSMAPASPIAKAPWGAASWARPRAHRNYSERPWESKPRSKADSCATETAAGAGQAWTRTSSVADASGGSMEASTTGELALPLGVDTASRITTVKVDNLAMVDSVSIEVKGRAVTTAVRW